MRKNKILPKACKTSPIEAKKHRFRPDDNLLAFLKKL